jgi:hypothetical protein
LFTSIFDEYCPLYYVLIIYLMAIDVAATTSYDRVLPRAGILVSRGLLYLVAIILVVSLAWAWVTHANMVLQVKRGFSIGE